MPIPTVNPELKGFEKQFLNANQTYNAVRLAGYAGGFALEFTKSEGLSKNITVINISTEAMHALEDVIAQYREYARIPNTLEDVATMTWKVTTTEGMKKRKSKIIKKLKP